MVKFVAPTTKEYDMNKLTVAPGGDIPEPPKKPAGKKPTKK